MSLSLFRDYTWYTTLFNLPQVMQLGFCCWVWWVIISSEWQIIRKISSVARMVIVKSGARSRSTLNVPTCQLMEPNTIVSCWFQDSGVWHAILTIQETWWGLWHTACLLALSTSCLISTSFTWPFCWYIVASGTNTVAPTSMAKIGSNILSQYLTDYCQDYFKWLTLVVQQKEYLWRPYMKCLFCRTHFFWAPPQKLKTQPM